MTTKKLLEAQIYRFGIGCAAIALVTTVVSFLLPLDVPDGYSALQSDRIAWLVAHRAEFVLGWINQMVAMLSLSGVFLVFAWRVSKASPLLAIVSAVVVLLSVVAFIIPKFIAVWTIPLLVDAIAQGSTGTELATQLLPLLNVSIPFSLYTSFDYLGFWLYAVFGLLVAAPLFQGKASTKIAALTLGVFGFLYHAAFAALLGGAIAAEEIETWFIGLAGLLLLVVLAALFVFRDAPRADPPAA